MLQRQGLSKPELCMAGLTFWLAPLLPSCTVQERVALAMSASYSAVFHPRSRPARTEI